MTVLTSEITIKSLKSRALAQCTTYGRCPLMFAKLIRHLLNVLRYTIYLPCAERRMDQDIYQIDLQILHLIFSILPEKNCEI